MQRSELFNGVSLILIASSWNTMWALLNLRRFPCWSLLFLQLCMVSPWITIGYKKESNLSICRLSYHNFSSLFWGRYLDRFRFSKNITCKTYPLYHFKRTCSASEEKHVLKLTNTNPLNEHFFGLLIQQKK